MKAASLSKEYLKSQYELEKAFHETILAENDREKRKQLYLDAYDTAYSRSLELSPEKVDFGYQNPEMNIVRHLLRNKTVIDFGCGYGSSTFEIGKYAKQVTGCDILEQVVNKANERLAEQPDVSNITFKKIEPAELPFDDNTADALYASDVIEHLHPDDASYFVKRTFQILKPGGIFICITPHLIYGPSDISVHFTPKGSQSKGFHLIEYDYASLIELIQSGGFKDIQTPLLSPRHLTKLPEGLHKLLFTSPGFRCSAEKNQSILNSSPLKRLLGLNRAVYLIARKPL